MTGCTASYTTPKPPRPSTPTIRYSPTASSAPRSCTVSSSPSSAALGAVAPALGDSGTVGDAATCGHTLPVCSPPQRGHLRGALLVMRHPQQQLELCPGRHE